MKSAYEIAMSRLEKQSPTAKLTDAQRAEIADIDSQIKAKIAQQKLFLEDEIRKSAQDPAAVEQLRKQLASGIARLEAECESRKDRVRNAAG